MPFKRLIHHLTANFSPGPAAGLLNALAQSWLRAATAGRSDVCGRVALASSLKTGY